MIRYAREVEGDTMSSYAISITKSVSFQGAAEEFSNAYTFDTAAGESFNDIQNIDWLVALEKAVFGTNVTFIRAASYGIGGTNAGNVMREVKDLTGTGSQNGMDMYRECALLVNFQLPRSLILRRRRIGRKWLHLGKFKTAPGSTTEAQSGSAAIAAADQTWYITNYAQKLVTETPPGGGDFSSGGDAFTSPTIAPYLEHRQLGRS